MSEMVTLQLKQKGKLSMSFPRHFHNRLLSCLVKPTGFISFRTVQRLTVVPNNTITSENRKSHHHPQSLKQLLKRVTKRLNMRYSGRRYIHLSNCISHGHLESSCNYLPLGSTELFIAKKDAVF